MKHCLIASVLVALACAGFVEPQAPKVPDPPVIVPGKFLTGAKPTPPDKIAAAIRAGKATIHRTTASPSSVIYAPKRMSYLGNNQYGDCVTAESCFSMEAYSVYVGLPKQIFITDAAAISWARSHGWLDGAFLLDVIQDMQRDGVKDEDGVLRKAGTPSAVNYSDEETLKSAIAQGPVSVTINASALPSGAGNKNGWYVFGSGQSGSNHNVSIFGYGATADLFKTLNVTAPANAPAFGYYVYTWSTIGVTDYPWIKRTVEEGWVRTPTVIDLGPTPPPPPPPAAITVIVPPAFGNPGVPVTITPTATGGTSPYLFLFDHGDSVQDASMQHTYKTAGSYTVTVTAVDSLGRLGSGTCVATIGTSPPPPPPGPSGSGTITWTIGGVTSQYELFPLGTRQKLQDVIGPTIP